jgi:hypothetical protein
LWLKRALALGAGSGHQQSKSEKAPQDGATGQKDQSC